MARRRRAGRRVAALCALALGLSAGTPIESPVAEAAMKGDADAVRTLLREGADVNAAQGDGMTALHWAAEHGDAAIAGMLIHAGARIDAVTRNGQYTPLHLASRAGGVEVVAALLAAKADATAVTTSGGATALHFAASHGGPRIVELLLDAGVEPDVRDAAFGQTPLMWAAARDRVDVIAVLLARGADISATSGVLDVPEREKEDRTDQQRRNRLVAAMRAATEPARPAAARTSADSVRPARDSTAAAPASASRDSAAASADSVAVPAQRAGAGLDTVATMASDSTPSPRSRSEPAESSDSTAPEPEPLSYGELVGGKGGLTPLLFAIRGGNTEAVLALLDAGADINQPGAGDGTTPLLAAALNGYFDLGMQLLERGADPDIVSNAGAAPLYAAINLQWAPKALYPQPTAQTQQTTTYLEFMQALLDAGADVNARLTTHLWYMSYNFDLLDVNTMGATPFWRAAYGTDVQAMRLLLAAGADPDIPTSRPPERRRRAAAGEEEKADPSGLPPVPLGGPGVWPIHAASGVGYGEGYAANAHRHVPDGWMPALKFLVEELGADVNARDYNGYTPLHHAAARGDDEMILYLIERGADVTAVSRRGQTTADMANGPVQRVQPFPATVELLEKLGSKNNHKCLSC